MKKISDLLNKFKQIAQEGDTLKDYIVSILNKNNIKNIEKKDISIYKSFIDIKTTPIKKSEIFLKQKNILSDLNSNPLLKTITKIK